jgi:transcriptional regulator with XRE-family HTH domain
VKKNEISQIVGAKIRKIRITQGLSIQNLAYEIGIEYTQLSRIERGKINTSIFQLFLISRALEVNFADIIQGLDNIEVKNNC